MARVPLEEARDRDRAVIPASSHHHLVAEAIAFPFWHESALESSPLSLDRDNVGVVSSPLARALQSHLCRHALGASLPQLDNLRDLAWFPERGNTVPLARHLARVACDHLELRGRRVGLRHETDGNYGELVERWRWISLALPPDLLVAALAATRNVSPPSEHVELVTAHLTRTLQAPCAETHLHVGAAIPFGVLWMGVVRSLADKGNHRELVAWLRGSFAGVIPFGDADRFLHLLRAASLARVAMAAFLRAHDNGAPADFDKYVPNWMRGVAAKVPWEWGPRDIRAGLSAMLGLVVAPRTKIALSHERARALLRAVLGKAPAAVDDPHRAAVEADPLSAWLTQRDHPALPETRFAARAIAYLLGPGVADKGFARMFWQYQRLRGATYRTLAQEPGIAGLHWFTRFYGRISFFRKLLPLHRGYEASWSHALRTESRDLNLGALETRTSPDATIDGNRNLLRAVTRQARAFTPDDGQMRPEIGLILHFIKEDSFKQNGTQHLHADPANLAFGARHAVWFNKQRRSAVAVASALRDHPELLLVLRGIDVANLEQAQPAWVLRPLFDIVRDASERASRRLAHAVPGWRVPPVRATLHAGEDYLRITEGLRRMHEAIEFGLLRQGDRFGHGLAVGANPETERGTTIAQPREERLDDLLWELDRYAHGDFNGSAARIEKVRHDATALARELLPSGHRATPEQMLEARRLRHDPCVLKRLRYPSVDTSRGPTDHVAWKLLVEHLTDRETFNRGRAPVAVESTAEERAMLVEAQRWMQCELARREITVESNPSSNLLIGDLHQMGDHPALRLQPPVSEGAHGHPVHLSVNTDNPVTFGSCLGDEFAFVYAALLRQGVSAREALSWIDDRREDGWRSRFTLEASASVENLSRLLQREPQRSPEARSAARCSAVVSGR